MNFFTKWFNEMKILIPVIIVFCFLEGLGQETLNNQSIIQMSTVKISSDIIIEKIKSSPNKFDLSTSGLISLSKAIVKDNVLEAMLLASNKLPVLKNQDIIDIYQNKVSRNIIQKKIEYSDSQFDTSSDGLIELKMAKIPEPIIKAMMTVKTSAEVESSTNLKSAEKPQEKKLNSVFRTAESRKDEKSTIQSNNTNYKIQCDEWFDKFKKVKIKTAWIDIRGWKPITMLLGTLSSVAGIEDAEIKSVLINEGGNLSILMYVSKPGSHTLMVDPDAPLYLMLKNDDVLEFKSNVNSEIDFSFSGNKIDTQMVVYYALPKEKATILSQNEIKSYRINLYNKKYIEDVIPDKNAQKFKLGIQCILN